MYLDFEEEWLYPNYVRDMYCPLEVKNPSKEDYPYQLEHIYNIDTGEYKYNKNQCCYWTPKEKCKYCTHPKKCIFDGGNWDVVATGEFGEVSREIKRLRELITTFRGIIDSHWNGEIVYHDELEDLYLFEVVRDSDGSLSFSVDVVPNFRGRVNSRIKGLELELRRLSRLKSRL